MDNKEKDFLISNIINSLIKDEWDAVSAYENAIATLIDYEDMEKIISVLEDIRDEEYVHIGQLQSCLSQISGNPSEQIDDGAEEGFEQLELPEEGEEETEVELEESVEDGREHLFRAKLQKKSSNDFMTTTVDAYGEEDARSKLWDKYPEYRVINIEQASSYGSSGPTEPMPTRRHLKLLKPKVEERLDKDVIKDMDIEEVKKRLLAVGFDAASFIGKSDKELRAMLKINRRARGDQTLRKWKKDEKVSRTDSKETPIQEEKKSTLSEKEMRDVICSMINKYDASEEEVFDELQSEDETVSRDLVHRLYAMCSGKEEIKESIQPTFDGMWDELDELED